MTRAPVAGGYLHARAWGEGPPLLLLRPLGGSIALWGAFAERLSAEHRVIAFDPRGVGGSSRAIPMSTREMARDAAAVLDHFAVERASVFGISLGGMVATWLAADTARVERLILASTMPWSLTARHAAPSTALPLAGCLARPSVECGACLVRRVLSPEFRRSHPGEVRRLSRLVRRERASKRTLWMHLAAAARHDGKVALERIRCPTLVMIGARDDLARPESQRWLASALHAQIAVLDSGHDLTLERPREAAAAVAAFIRG